MKTFSRFPCFVAMALWFAFIQPVAAQSVCAGDCGRNNEVTVDEILALVNIALGSGDVATCTAGDRNTDGEITVDEIVAALQNALDGCPQNATQTWIESDLRLVQSACPSELTELLEEGLATDGICATEIAIDGDQVTAVDCEGGVTMATIGEDGVATTSESMSEQIGDCLFEIELIVRVDLRLSPTTTNYDVNVSTSGTCPFAACEMLFASTLTRQ
jgi:hypothetical protein